MAISASTSCSLMLPFSVAVLTLGFLTMEAPPQDSCMCASSGGPIEATVLPFFITLHPNTSRSFAAESLERMSPVGSRSKTSVKQETSKPRQNACPHQDYGQCST